jgi:large subunit ribosomal protein L3
MISGFIAKKGPMTNTYSDKGKRISATKLIVKPLVVSQLKTIDKDGYRSVQVAFGVKKRLDQSTAKKVKKLKLDFNPQRFQEFDLTTDTIPEVGSFITVDSVLEVGETVDITGTSKGRGFAGVIKRYGFQRQPVSGGQSDRVRAPGAIGAQTPGKVIKGKKMPGHYGNVTKTVTNLKIVSINPETNEILVSGSVPGVINSWVTIKKLKKL